MLKTTAFCSKSGYWGSQIIWLTIRDKYIFEICTTVYKALTGLYSEWCLKLSTVVENTKSTTRQQNNLYVPQTRKEPGARATALLGPKL